MIKLNKVTSPMKEYICNIDQLSSICAGFSKELKVRDVILLNGDLGTGKTTFTKLLVQHLGGNLNDVTSPTFNLMHQYQTKNFDVWHFDLYRLKSVDELYNIGIEEALMSGVSILEWGDIAKSFLSGNYIEISFQYINDIKKRKLTIRRFFTAKNC